MMKTGELIYPKDIETERKETAGRLIIFGGCEWCGKHHLTVREYFDYGGKGGVAIFGKKCFYESIVGKVSENGN